MPDAARGSGLALLNTITGIAKLLSSVAFGVPGTLTSTRHASARPPPIERK